MTRLRPLLNRLVLAAAFPLLACGAGPDTSGAGPEKEQVARDVRAEVSAVRGPGGLTSPSLDPGTFLGAGAQLQTGTRYDVPAGSMVEVRLAHGATVRANESTGLTIGSGEAALEVHSGEVVVLATASSPTVVKAGPDLVRVDHGEVQIIAGEDSRHYAVVHGEAVLEAGDEKVPLGPGASITTPLTDPRAMRPRVSLQPLERTAWSRSFDEAARMAAEVPRGIGSLTARRAGSSAERQALALVDQQVHVSISGRVARTEVEQTFRNDSGEVLEGIYRFPLPADASISGLELLVGNRWMKGEMLEKQRARAIFKEIVDATIPRDPALLQWEHGNVFKLRIFPIPGRGERKIRLAYTQVLPAVGDSLRYRYPLGGSGSGATGTTIESFAFDVNVDRADLDPARLDDLRTPMLPLERHDEGDRVVLSTRRDGFLPAFDVGVDLPVPAASFHAETHLDRDGQAYFMAVMRPELPVEPPEKITDYAIVFDRSHGTTPELWTAARGLWHAMADVVREGDRVAVLACDTACEVAPGALAPLNADRRGRVDGFLDGQILAGASDVGAMFQEAAGVLAGSDARKVIIYLGDGVATSGELATDKLVRRLEEPLRDVRVEAVALGARSDTLALEALTRAAGGGVLMADARDDMQRVARELQLRAVVPVIRDVELDLPSQMVQVHPRGPISVRAGEAITVVGKLRNAVNDEIRLSGRGPNGERVGQVFPVQLDARRGHEGRSLHLPRTWAQEEIEWLTTSRGHDARGEIVALSQDYTVLSRYTALLVLENDAMYREFGVARRANDKDAWKGKLAGATKSAEGSVPAVAAGAEKSADASAADEAERQSAASQPTGGLPAEPLPPPAPMDTRWDDALAKNDWDNEPETEAEAAEEVFDDDEDSSAPGMLGTGRGEAEGGKSSSGASRPASRPAPRPTSKPKKKRPRPAPDMNDPYMGDDFGGGGGGGAGPHELPVPRPSIARDFPRVRVREARPPSNTAMQRVATLLSDRNHDERTRSRHRRLVRAAVASGHPEAPAFAAAWAEADPDHGPALRAHANMLAAAGDPAALRAHASVAEVQPFSARTHESLADAFARKGDLSRSCSHRLALVSIEPASGSHHAGYARCLARRGDLEAARRAVADGLSRARTQGGELSDVRTQLDRGAVMPASASLHAGADLRVTLEWNGPADLDLVVVDASGKRMSSLWANRLRVDEQPGRETVTLKRVRKTHHIEVSRFDGGGDPVHATLRIRTPGGNRSFPVEISRGTVRVAKITWSR